MLFSIAVLLSGLAAVKAASVSTLQERTVGNYVQSASGSASFTHYSGCGAPACGKTASGYTAAINQLAFGSGPGLGAGDACGRCFALTGNADPYSPNYTGPFGKSIVVKVTDLCPTQGNQEWCGQTQSNRNNQHGKAFHFDICDDTGGSAQFFPSGHGALTGTFTEVSCSQWSGSDGGANWNGACLSGETAGNWPATGCGNKGKSIFLVLSICLPLSYPSFPISPFVNPFFRDPACALLMPSTNSLSFHNQALLPEIIIAMEKIWAVSGSKSWSTFMSKK